MIAKLGHILRDAVGTFLVMLLELEFKAFFTISEFFDSSSSRIIIILDEIYLILWLLDCARDFFLFWIYLSSFFSQKRLETNVINLPSSIILKSSHCVQFYIDYCYCKFCIKEEEEEYMIEKQWLNDDWIVRRYVNGSQERKNENEI